MNADQIIRFFTLLGEWLAEDPEVHEPYKFLLIGGGFMLTQVGNRDYTEDIDGIVLSTTRETREQQIFSQVAAEVTEQMLLEGVHARLEDDFGDHLKSATWIETKSSPRLWLQHGMLEVYVPEERAILALKLEAGREKDMEDIRVLMERVGISTREEAMALLRYYYRWWIRRGRAKQLKAALDRVFG